MSGKQISNDHLQIKTEKIYTYLDTIHSLDQSKILYQINFTDKAVLSNTMYKNKINHFASVIF